jgi:ABC-type bacteriocin/lantibiotic exporter with double-glycine peptidase domain
MRPTVILGLALALSSGCYAGAGHAFTPARFEREPGWISVGTVPIMQQKGERDCGAVVTAMLLGYWGVPATDAEVRAASKMPADRGLTAEFLRDYVRARGLQAFLFEGNLADFERELRGRRPLLVGVLKPYSNNIYAHYQLVVAMNTEREELVVIDPADGWRVYPFEGFAKEWRPTHFLTMAVVPGPSSNAEGESQ